jgi:hypothetical protein
LAQETANELIRIRARDVLKLAFAAERKSISNARNLFGKEGQTHSWASHHDLISMQELAKPRD